MPRERQALPTIDIGSRLKSDCERCFGLCCVALPFAKSADFPVEKAAGQPCGNLTGGYRCGIHNRLRDRGYGGCAVFECFGAGQQVSQVTYGGRDWRGQPDSGRQMFHTFVIMRQLHEMLCHLAEALDRPASRPLRRELGTVLAEIQRHTEAGPEALLALDVAAVRSRVGPLLRRVSELVRAGVPGATANHRAADLVGARLRRAALRGADLRGAYLIAADLREADLRDTDLLGADLRSADLRGADLRGSLFLTQPQLNAAKGDASTRLPAAFTRPAHWGRRERLG